MPPNRQADRVLIALTDRTRPLAALIIGGLSALAFQPVGWWPLMVVAIGLLCSLLDRAPTLKHALFTGWCFGVGQFVIGLNWIATAFTYQAAMPAWLGWIAVVLLSLYLAIFPALAAGLAWRFGRDNPLALVLALAGSWALTEWLRAKLFTGFAWNPIGVALTDTPWLKLSTFVGTYGLSMLTALAGGALWLAYQQRWWSSFGIAASLGLLLTLPTPYVAEDCCLSVFDADRVAGDTDPADRNRAATTTPPPPAPAPNKADLPPPPPTPPVPDADPPPALSPEQQAEYLRDNRVWHGMRVVQPNIGQQDKWRPGFSEEAARRLAALSVDPGRTEPRLLFWPEAAVTEPLEDARTGEHQAYAEFERTRAAALVRPGEYLLTGGIAFFSKDGQRVTGAANSVFVLGHRGQLVARYDKAHLVPYGEYLPMRPLLSAIGLSRLAPGDIDFVPGPGPRTIALPGWGKVGFQICYEIIFSGEVVDRRNRPDYIFNPSNDAWFGAWGPPQHLAQARLRAVEEGIPVIRSTPTGISALIDARGRIIDSIPWGQAGAFNNFIPMTTLTPTLFSRFGNIIPIALGFVLLIAAIALSRRRRYPAAT